MIATPMFKKLHCMIQVVCIFMSKFWLQRSMALIEIQEKQQKEVEEVDIQQLLEQDQQKREALTKNIEKNILRIQ